MSITVFLADDHAVVRDGLKLWLEIQADFPVVGEAPNGREALRQATRRRNPDALTGWSTACVPGKRGPGIQTPPFQPPKLLPVTVKVFPSNCQNFLTDRRDSHLKLIGRPKDSAGKNL